jgi:branched-chain amino acid transport system ATP-binding protein
MVPEGRGVFSRMTITENLQMGAFVRKDVKEIAADIDKVFAIFPRPEGAPPPARRHDERRRAADAGDGPGADGAAQGAAARRAVDGPLADHGRQDLRGGERHPPQGTTILLVEQNASRALQIASRGYVMDSRRGDDDRRRRSARSPIRRCAPPTSASRPGPAPELRS